MTYIAVATNITVLGQTFESFKTEDGQVVFSQSSSATGLDIGESSIRSLRQSKAIKAIQGKGSVTRSLRTVKSNNPIAVVTMAELTAIVSLLSERGKPRAIAMQQASFAVTLQMAVDTAYGVNRENQEYLDSAADLARRIEKHRKELRTASGAITNPTLACNLYNFNNDLVYGEGFTRDTYEGDDTDKKHWQETSLELIQSGLKLAGMSLEDIKVQSPILLGKLSK